MLSGESSPLLALDKEKESDSEGSAASCLP
jgi:hypothetical protein